mmetsp:Transcript_42378/g.73688  ORF Transcript_42378/g.73688 Transcript_42378/m.73688 type:complete len:110 (-) Transcript_42378:483-812(-)
MSTENAASGDSRGQAESQQQPREMSMYPIIPQRTERGQLRGGKEMWQENQWDSTLACFNVGIEALPPRSFSVKQSCCMIDANFCSKAFELNFEVMRCLMISDLTCSLAR